MHESRSEKSCANNSFVKSQIKPQFMISALNVPFMTVSQTSTRTRLYTCKFLHAHAVFEDDF